MKNSNIDKIGIRNPDFWSVRRNWNFQLLKDKSSKPTIPIFLLRESSIFHSKTILYQPFFKAFLAVPIRSIDTL